MGHRANFRSVLRLLSYHAPIKEPREALNRLIKKAVEYKYGVEAAEAVPYLSEDNTFVRYEQRTLSQLSIIVTKRHQALLIKQKYHSLEPAYTHLPIIICIWKKRNYLLDGRRRYALWVRSKNKGPHPAYIIYCNHPKIKKKEIADTSNGPGNLW